MSYGVFFGCFVSPDSDCPPLAIKTIGDLGYNDSELHMLEGWHAFFKENGRDAMVNKIIEIGRRMEGASPYHDAILSGLPKSDKEFKERIEFARNRLVLELLEYSFGMTRFFWDFFGEPICARGYNPDSLTFDVPGHLTILFNREDLETITRHPSLPVDDLIKRCFPKARDDILLCDKLC